MDAILGFLNNPVVLTTALAIWGLVVRFAPGFAKFPNATIPYINAVLALLVKLGAPQDAQAAEGLDTLAVAAVGATHVSFWTQLAASIGQALLNALLYDKFLKAPAKKQILKAPAKKKIEG